jgi:hypothetical protein
MKRISRIVAPTIGLALLLGASNALAQMYTTGPGLYMSLEGRSLQNSGDGLKLSPPNDNAADRFSDRDSDNQGRNGKSWDGKAALDYRFQNNWDIGVSSNGLKNLR